MKKTKNGEVIASLTEVKNKTGDIFALADEFGEVVLTSYNKPRYKLIKLDIASILEEETVKEPKKVVKKQKVETKKEVKSEEVNEMGDIIDDEVRLDTWNRSSENEMKYINNIVKPLIS